MIAGSFTLERRPPRIGERVRVCPIFGIPSDYRMVYAPDEHDWYPVDASISRCVGRLPLVRVLLCENTAGERFLWCIDLDGALPSDDSPMAAELVMAKAAESVWCSRRATAAGWSFTTYPRVAYPEPIWGSLSFSCAIEAAFCHRIITSLDHPLLVARRGAR